MKHEYYSLLFKFLIRNKKVNKLFEKKRIFFIFALGRSGTNFLANLLNKSENALVVHEPVGNDFRAYRQAFNNESNAFKYIKNFRLKEIYHRIKNEKKNIYGEVNGVLRNHCIPIINYFPDNTLFFHLVRDGRDVVRSIYSRKSFADDPNNKIIVPRNGDPYELTWDISSKFKKLCWFWKTENEYLYNNIDKIIQFEKIISDYDYFKENVLDPIGLNISKEIWKKEINKPKNITVQYEIPYWKEWSKKMKTIFDYVCGDLMRKLGYI